MIGDGYKAIAIPGTTVPTRLAVIDPKYQPYQLSKYPGYEILLPLPLKGGTSTFRLYSGLLAVDLHDLHLRLFGLLFVLLLDRLNCGRELLHATH